MNIDVNTIIDSINDNMSMDDLCDIVKEAMSKIYCKLKDDMGMINPAGIINSLGEKSYYVNITFLDSEICNSGESYEQVYHL